MNAANCRSHPNLRMSTTWKWINSGSKVSGVKHPRQIEDQLWSLMAGTFSRARKRSKVDTIVSNGHISGLGESA